VITGKNFKIIGNDISDGYHTFEELYEHRCLLFIALCLANRELAYWRPHYEGWPLLGLNLPTGQITYHVPEKFLGAFEGKILQGGPAWDGHTADDVLRRMRDWIKEQP
jgi:hypothetical protein